MYRIHQQIQYILQSISVTWHNIFLNHLTPKLTGVWPKVLQDWSEMRQDCYGQTLKAQLCWVPVFTNEESVKNILKELALVDIHENYKTSTERNKMLRKTSKEMKRFCFFQFFGCPVIVCFDLICTVFALFFMYLNINNFLSFQWGWRSDTVSFARQGCWGRDWRCSTQWDCASLGSGYCCREKLAKIYKNSLLLTTACIIRC